jgi:hypothetical protein
MMGLCNAQVLAQADTILARGIEAQARLVREAKAQRDKEEREAMDAYLDELHREVHDRLRQPVRVDETIVAKGTYAEDSPVYRLVAKAVYRCIDAGVSPALLPTFSANEGAFEKSDISAQAHYDDRRGLVVLRPSHAGLSSAWASYAKAEGEDPDAKAMDILLHEIGHALRHVRMGVHYWRPYDAYPRFQEIAKAVSDYATKDHHEFCAETFAGMMQGRIYGPEIMAMYEHFGGYLPKKPTPIPSPVEKAAAPGQQAQPINVTVVVPPEAIKIEMQPGPAPVVNVAPELMIPPRETRMTVIHDEKTGRIVGSTSETRDLE